MLKIEITNDETGTDRSANYTYVVRANDKVLEVGTIRGHDRSDGWRYLVTLIGTPHKFRSAIPVGVTIESAPNNSVHMDSALPEGHSGSSLECTHPFCVAERESPSQ